VCRMKERLAEGDEEMDEMIVDMEEVGHEEEGEAGRGR
jgi:hypothetical protein